MNTLHVKKGDTVVVLSGDAKRHMKGEKGEVLEVSPKERKVIVKGVNLVKKHVKPRKQGEAGGILTVEGPIYADKVALYCAKCDAGRRSKMKIEADGTKVRVCAKCGEKI